MTRHRDGGVWELRFRAETVTPLFMAGAVPGGPEAELRAPSVRGALRFWFRAGMGAAGVTDAKELHRLEAALFGDTRRASRVRVAWLDPSRLVPRDAGEPLQVPADQGFLYLSCQALYRAHKGQVELNRGCYLHGGSFRLRLALLPGFPGAEALILASLWLLAHLGGLGARTRRGFGSLRLVPDDAATLEAARDAGLPFVPASDADMATHLSTGLEAAARIYGKCAGRRPPSGPPACPAGDPSWTSLHGARVLLCPDVFGCWQDALARAGGLLVSARRRANPDYSALKDFLQSPYPPPATVHRASFGLPMQFGYRSLMKAEEETLLQQFLGPHVANPAAEASRILSLGRSEAASELSRVARIGYQAAKDRLQRNEKTARRKYTARVQGPSDSTDRRASPLFFRVLRGTTAGYRLLAAFLPSQKLLPGKMRVFRESGLRQVPEPDPPFGAVEDFMDTLVARGWTAVV